MSKKIRWLAVLTVCILLIAAQASAQRIVFTGGECPLQMINPEIFADSGKSELQEVYASDLHVFGRIADGILVVLCNGNTAGYIPQSALEELDPTLDLSGIGEWTYPETMEKGLYAKELVHFQELLNSLNYYVGGADGIFGNKTKEMVTLYQTDMGLEATGNLDLATQLSLEAKAASDEEEPIEINFQGSHDPAQVYKAIYGNVKEDLQAFADAGWRLTYDEFDGKGELNTRAQLGGYEIDDTQVDRLQLTSKLIIMIEDVLTDAPRMYPALCVNSKGASSIYMRSVDIKRGSDVATLELIDSTRTLEGLDLYEKAYFMVSEEALQLMRDVEKGELSVRLNCQNTKFLLKGADDDKAIEAFCNVCLESNL